MKTYTIKVPITAIAIVEVTGDFTEEEAIAESIDIATLDDVEESEAHSIVVEGNFFYGKLNKACVEDIFEEED